MFALDRFCTKDAMFSVERWNANRAENLWGWYSLRSMC